MKPTKFGITTEEARKEIQGILDSESLIPDDNYDKFFNTEHDTFGGKTLNEYLELNPKGAVGTVKRMFL